MAKISKFKERDICMIIGGSFPDMDVKPIHFIRNGDMVIVCECIVGYDECRVKCITVDSGGVMVDQIVSFDHLVKVGEAIPEWCDDL